MSSERIKLNMGYILDDEGDACEWYVDKEMYMPEDHRYLFAFLNADIESLIHMVNDSVAERNPAGFRQAEEEIGKLHPYFRDKNYRKACIQETAALLAWHDPHTAVETLKALGITGEDYLDPEAWTNAGGRNGTLQSLLKCQLRNRRKVVLLLDDSNPELAKTPMTVRSGLFGIVDGDMRDTPVLTIETTQYVLPVSASIRTLGVAMDFDEDAKEAFHQSIENLVATGELSEQLQSVLRSAEAEEEPGYTMYKTEDLEQIIDLEIFLMLQEGIRLKKCESCGKYFPITKENERFCDIPDESGSSCLRRYLQKKYEQEVKEIYTRAYRTHFARVKAGKESKEDLDQWRIDAQVMQKDVYSGIMRLAAYQQRISKLLSEKNKSPEEEPKKE